MRDTARKKDGRQEATAQLVFAAMIDARATLHDAIVSAGMSVLSAMLEEERTKLCGPRYAHVPDRIASRAGHADGELAFGRTRFDAPEIDGCVQIQDGADAGLVPGQFAQVHILGSDEHDLYGCVNPPDDE